MFRTRKREIATARLSLASRLRRRLRRRDRRRRCQIDFLVGARLLVLVRHQILGGEIVVALGLLGAAATSNGIGCFDFSTGSGIQACRTRCSDGLVLAEVVESGSSIWDKCAWCPIRASP
jgi:hypothetical protein